MHRPVLKESNVTYRHTQRAPLCVLLYVLAAAELALAWTFRNELPIVWTLSIAGAFILVLAASFHHLTVDDQGDALAIAFGPVPLFRRRVPYATIVGATVDRTTILDGWGIHLSLRGGWVWNIWGRDCVRLQLRRGTLRVGTDDAENLARFVGQKIADEARA